MMHRVFVCISVFMLAGAAAQAATCSVSGSAAFGQYNSLANQAMTTQGTIAVTCTGTVNETVDFTVALSPGLGSYSDRTMVSGSVTMHYNLYKDPGCTQVWGDGTSSTAVITDSMTLASGSMTKYYTVYSRISGSQTQLTAGSYADSVTVALTY